MSKFRLSKAMNAVPDDMLQEAMEVKKKGRTGWVIFRAAACLAVVVGLVFAAFGGGSGVVTGPGILAVTAYAADGEPFVVSDSDTVVPFSHRWGPFVNWAPGWPLTLNVPEGELLSENIRFQVTVDGGGYYVGVNGGPSIYPVFSTTMPAQFTVPNNTTIFWSMWYDAASGEHTVHQGKEVYTQIIIYDETHIIGYVVLRFDRFTYGELDAEYYEQLGVPLDEYAQEYQLEVLASVSFPKVDGEYQEISEEYVWQQIAKCHQQDGGRQ